MSGLFPVIHATFIYPYAEWNRQAAAGYYLIEGLTLLLGTVFYAVSTMATASTGMSD
jgi:adiponectin receptor